MSESTTENSAQEPVAESSDSVRLRVWPGLLAVLVVFVARYVPMALFPESPKAFMPMMMGIQGGYLLLVLWWLFASRVPWKDRMRGLAIVAVAAACGLGFAFHESLRGQAAMLPIMFTIGPFYWAIVVGAMALTGPLGWQSSKKVTVAVALLAIAAIGLVRYEGADSGFAPKFLARWQSTAEERLIAAANDAPVQAQDKTIEATAGDWPGFRGPNRDGHVPGGSLAGDWTSKGLVEIWRREVGPGWSSFCVVGGMVITQEQRGEEEWIAAYDADTGDPVWHNAVKARFFHSMGGAGPRATPTFFEGSLYVQGAEGQLQRLNAATGDTVWSRDLLEDLSLNSPPEWGFSSSPLIVTLASGQNLSVVHAGDFTQSAPESSGWVVAYDCETGEEVWKTPAGNHSYSSPHQVTLNDVPQVLVSTNDGLEALDPSSGKRLWFYDWSIDQFCRSIQPLVVDEQTVVLSAGYDSGTQLLRVTNDGGAWATEMLWHSHDLEPYFNDMVLHEGHLYGIHKKFLVSIDLETGEPTWPRKVKRKSRFGNGQLVLDPTSGMLLVTHETSGEILLVEANPETLVIRSRLEALAPDTNWNHPVIAHGRLYLRNGAEAVCYELPVAEVALRE